MRTRRAALKVIPFLGDTGLSVYSNGDVVVSSIDPHVGILGVIVDVCSKTGKLLVNWGQNSVSQHSPDEVRFAPDVTFEQKRALQISRRGRLASIGHTVPRSRRAMYWRDKGRQYTLSRQEVQENIRICPKCKSEMDIEPYSKKEKLLICTECGFKITTGCIIDKSVTVDVMQDGEVKVDVS